jgi:hypothetical protein
VGCQPDDPDKSKPLPATTTLSGTTTGTTTGSGPTATEPDPFEDLDPDPNVFEAELRARVANLWIDGELTEVLTYGGSLPGPEIRVTQGDRVRIHLTNELPEDYPTTIHWHGIEGTNAMDGTPVTQDPVEPGDSFTYDFIAPRPGIYWYHPHIRGSRRAGADRPGGVARDPLHRRPVRHQHVRGRRALGRVRQRDGRDERHRGRAPVGQRPARPDLRGAGW